MKERVELRGNVFVIGLGLIGGSVALAIKNTHPDAVITGFDIHEDSLQLAKALGIIDVACSSLQECAEQADLIILGTPVKQTEELLSQFEEFDFKRNCIITDVGSTKTQITKAASFLRSKGVTFIGGHPMAGSHKSGPAAAKAHLFEHAFYLLTPTEDVGEKEMAELKMWLRGTKANFLVVTPETHDQLTGVISHFPHIIAASLVRQAKKTTGQNQLVTRLAAGGFRDITRIASSSPEMWRDILLQNRDVLLELMDDWIEDMNEVKEFIRTGDSEHIYDFFSTAKSFRDELPNRAQGAIPAFYDLYVDVPDYAGVISEVIGYLAEERISIVNIRILETREELYGVLVLSFQCEEDRIKAEKCIEKNTNFSVYIT